MRVLDDRGGHWWLMMLWQACWVSCYEESIIISWWLWHLGLRVTTGCYWVFHLCSKLWESRKSGWFFSFMKITTKTSRWLRHSGAWHGLLEPCLNSAKRRFCFHRDLLWLVGFFHAHTVALTESLIFLKCIPVYNHCEKWPFVTISPQWEPK